MTLVLEQFLNGVQFGVTLFLLAAGLTLIFGIMGVINLAHGSLYMIGAYAAALVVERTGSFLLAVPAGLLAAAAAGLLIEYLVIRRLYARDHVHQVLATFGLILFINEGATILFGRQPLLVTMPAALSGAVEIIPGIPYPTYRLVIIAAGLLVGVALYVLVNKTRVGMLVRAGSTHREMVRALGVDIRLLYTLVFSLGALLAGLAGLMTAPLIGRASRHGRANSDFDIRRRGDRWRGLGPGRVLRGFDRRNYRYTAARLPAGSVAPGHANFGGGRAGGWVVVSRDLYGDGARPAG